jgi:hypothetical protein
VVTENVVLGVLASISYPSAGTSRIRFEGSPRACHPHRLGAGN